MRIFDCSIYAGERSLLATRVGMLEGLVDEHVVIESDLTIQGRRRHVAPLPDEVEHVELTHTVIHLNRKGGPSQSWQRQAEMRNAIGLVLARRGAIGGDIVLLSDIDEIPSYSFVETASETDEPLLAVQDMRMFALDWWYGDWGGTCAFRFQPDVAMETMRNAARGDFTHVGDGGWHLSWMGGPAAWRMKVDSFSHADLRGTTDRALLDCWLTGHDLAGTRLSRISPPKFMHGVAENPWWFRWHDYDEHR